MQPRLTFLALATIISLATLSTHAAFWDKFKKQNTIDNTLPFPHNLLPNGYLEELKKMSIFQLNHTLMEECIKSIVQQELIYSVPAQFKYTSWINLKLNTINFSFNTKNFAKIFACINAGADPNKEITYIDKIDKQYYKLFYFRPIYLAITAGSYEQVAFLLNKGCNPNLAAYWQSESLSSVIYPIELAKTVEMAKLIVGDNRINLNNKYLKNNLQYFAIQPGYSPDLIRFYEEKGASVHVDLERLNPLIALINNCSYFQTPKELRELAQKVRILLSLGLQPDAKFERYQQMITPLSLCKEKSNQEKGRGPATVILEIFNTHMENRP